MKKFIVCLISLCILLSVFIPITLVTAGTDTGVYKIVFDGKTTGGPFYTLTDDLKIQSKSVSVKFRYYLDGTNGEVALVNLSNSETLLSMNKGWNNCNIEKTDFSGDFCLGIKVMDATAASDAVVYLKNVIITVNNEDKFDAIATQFFSNDPAELKFIDEADLPEDSPENEKPAYLIDFNNIPAENFYTLSTDTWEAQGKAVSISFKYYLTNAANDELWLQNVAAGGAFKDNATNSDLLKSGLNTFEYTTDSFERAGFCIGITVSTGKTTNAKLYIWDVVITVGGTDMFSATASQYSSDPKPTLTTITYGDIPFGPGVVSKAAYFIKYNNTAQGKGYTVSADTWEAKGKAVSISFKYYLKNAENNDLYVENLAGGGSFADSETGSGNLLKGEHTFAYTTNNYEKDGFCVGLTVGKSGGLNAELYIWDVSIKVGATEMFSETSTQYGNDGTATLDVIYFDDVPFENQEDDDKEDDKENEKPEFENKAYLLKFAQTPQGKGYNISDGIWDVKGKAISISFKYYLKNAENNDLFVENFASGGGFEDAMTGSANLLKGKHAFTYSTDSYTRDGFCLGIEVGKTGTSNAQLYLWDIVVTVGGNEIFSDAVTQYKNDGTISLTAMEYDDIPFEKDSSTQGTGTSKKEKKFYLIDFKGTSVGSPFYTISDAFWGAKGKAVTVAFDYYLADAVSGEIFVENVASGGGIKDNKTDSMSLASGKNSFKFTTKSFDKDGLCVGIKVLDEKVASKAKLYIWNITITYAGSDIFGTDVTQWCELKPLPKMTAIKENDIPKDKSTGSQAAAHLDAEDKYMLLQKNYCYVEGKGVLQYEAFSQWIGKNHNGADIKAETDYILSFDYYADPGEFGSGVMTNYALIKTLDTGYNEVLTKSNMACLWDEDEQKYGGLELPGLGYHHIEIEFTTLENQTDFVFALESGTEGDAYYWNFNLVEKGTTKNLLTYSSFVYSDINDISAEKVGNMGWHVSTDCYEFVEFNKEYASLKDGEIVGGGDIEDSNNSSNNGSVNMPIFNDDDLEEDSGMPLYVIIIIIAGSVVLLGSVATTLIILNKKGIIKLGKKK